LRRAGSTLLARLSLILKFWYIKSTRTNPANSNAAIMEDPSDPPPNYEKICSKQKKRIGVLENAMAQMMAQISMLESEIGEKQEKKRTDYAIVQSIGSSFLDKKKKKGKSHFNKHMRPVWNALIWELWKEYLAQLVDGDDKPWDLIRMDNEGDLYDEAVAKDFFEYVFDIYQKRIASGDITEIADDGTPSSSAANSVNSSPAHVSPAGGRAFVQPPVFNESNLFRFGIDINAESETDDDDETNDQSANPQPGAKRGADK
jgi:hypothetical protein